MARFSPILIGIACGFGVTLIVIGSFLMMYEPSSAERGRGAEQELDGY